MNHLSHYIFGAFALSILGACQTTGDPYEDSFFFSPEKAEIGLAAKRAELAGLEQKLALEMGAISSLRAKYNHMVQQQGGLTSELAVIGRQIDAADFQANNLHQQVTALASQPKTKRPIEVLDSEIAILNGAISKIDSALGLYAAG